MASSSSEYFMRPGVAPLGDLSEAEQRQFRALFDDLLEFLGERLAVNDVPAPMVPSALLSLGMMIIADHSSPLHSNEELIEMIRRMAETVINGERKEIHH